MKKLHLLDGHDQYSPHELNPIAAGRRLYFKGGSTSSASSSQTANTSEDNRVANQGGLVVGGGLGMFDASVDSSVNVQDSSNRSTNIQDSSNRSVNVSDTSNRSVVNNTTTTTTDGGAFNLVGRGVDTIIGGAVDMFDTVNATARLQTTNETNRFAGLLTASNTQTQAALTAGQAGLNQGYTGFGALLGAAEKLWSGNDKAISTATNAIAGAYQSATAEKAGGVDNKTIMILGVAGAVALAVIARK